MNSRCPSAICVLSAAIDPELRHLREMVVRVAGILVDSPESVPAMMDAVDAGQYDVMLLGHCLSPDVRNKLIQSSRRQWPRAKIILITRAGNAPGVERPDAEVDSLAGPEELVKTIRQMASQRDSSLGATHSVVSGRKMRGPEGTSGLEEKTDNPTRSLH